MKIYVLAAILPLAACSLSDGGAIVGVKSPRDASGVMLSSRPTADVAACISDKLRVAAQPEGNVLVIVSPGTRPVSYRVHPIQDRYGRYSTQVDQIGDLADDQIVVSSCILPSRT